MMDRVIDARTRAMVAVAGTVAATSALSPRLLLRLFGVAPADVTGAAEFGWRLFAVRTAFISGLAARGNTTARDAFLPIQLLDQAVFWHAFASRSVPRRTAVLAATASGVIIALDLSSRRRRQSVG